MFDFLNVTLGAPIDELVDVINETFTMAAQYSLQ
jgi:hypothetical protein